MKYKREIIVSNLCETSRSKRDGVLLPESTKKYQVYDLDKLKDEFCKNYRHDNKLKSCDAYYYDQYNQLIIEFKNTGYQKLKEYYDDIEIKIIDTHMLMAETFYRNKKSADLSKRVSLILVYNNALNYGKGICQIGNALNTMKPKKGNTARNTSAKQMFENKAEFSIAVGETKSKYEGDFYKEILFIDKKDFERDYIGTGFFNNLMEWSEMV